MSDKMSDNQYMKLIIEQTDDIFYQADKKGGILYVSPQVRRIGISPEEIMDNGIFHYIHPEDLGSTLMDFQKSILSGEEFPTEFRIVNKKGEISWFEDYGKIVYNETGEITGIAGILRNISKRKNAERKTKESEKKYSKLFHNSNDAILFHDLEGSIKDINQKAIEQFGYTRKEFLSLNLKELHPESSAELSESMFEKICNINNINFEIEFIKKDGGIFKAEVSSSLFEISGKKYIQGIIRDITERIKLETEKDVLIKNLSRVISEIKRSNTDLEKFAHIVSHDLKSPVNTVSIYIKLLMAEYKKFLPEEALSSFVLKYFRSDSAFLPRL